MVDDGFYVRLAERVRSRREELTLTQADLALRAGVSRSSVANIETGRQAVLLHQFLGLASALEMSWEDLMPKPTVSPDIDVVVHLPKGVEAFVASISPPSAGRRRKS